MQEIQAFTSTFPATIRVWQANSVTPSIVPVTVTCTVEKEFQFSGPGIIDQGFASALATMYMTAITSLESEWNQQKKIGCIGQEHKAFVLSQQKPDTSVAIVRIVIRPSVCLSAGGFVQLQQHEMPDVILGFDMVLCRVGWQLYETDLRSYFGKVKQKRDRVAELQDDVDQERGLRHQADFWSRKQRTRGDDDDGDERGLQGGRRQVDFWRHSQHGRDDEGADEYEPLMKQRRQR